MWTNRPTDSARMRGALAAALVLVAGGAALWGGDALGQTRVRAELQDVADRAALAAVNALVSNIANSPAVQAQAAITASGQVTGEIAGARSTVRPVAATQTVTVEISATPQAQLFGLAWHSKPVTVIGRAGYIGPDLAPEPANEPVATFPDRKPKDALSG